MTHDIPDPKLFHQVVETRVTVDVSLLSINVNKFNLSTL